MNSWRGSQNYVANGEMPLFVRNLLPILKEHYKVEIKAFDPGKYEPEAVAFELYLDAPQNDMIPVISWRCMEKKSIMCLQGWKRIPEGMTGKK